MVLILKKGSVLQLIITFSLLSQNGKLSFLTPHRILIGLKEKITHTGQLQHHTAGLCTFCVSCSSSVFVFYRCSLQATLLPNSCSNLTLRVGNPTIFHRAVTLRSTFLSFVLLKISHNFSPVFYTGSSILNDRSAQSSQFLSNARDIDLFCLLQRPFVPKLWSFCSCGPISRASVSQHKYFMKIANHKSQTKWL